MKNIVQNRTKPFEISLFRHRVTRNFLQESRACRPSFSHSLYVKEIEKIVSLGKSADPPILRRGQRRLDRIFLILININIGKSLTIRALLGVRPPIGAAPVDPSPPFLTHLRPFQAPTLGESSATDGKDQKLSFATTQN